MVFATQSCIDLGVIAKAHTAAPFYPPAPHGDTSVVVKPIRAYLQVRGYTCGYASTLTVLHAFQRRIKPVDLYKRLGTDHGGTGQTAIIRELRASGVSANLRYNLDFEALKRSIDAGKLIIGYHHRVEHWVVIYGYGTSPNRVFIADPVVEWKSEHLWDTYGPKLQNFGIVCSGKRRARTGPMPVVPTSCMAIAAPGAQPLAQPAAQAVA